MAKPEEDTRELKVVSWWSDEKPEIETFLKEIEARRDITGKIQSEEAKDLMQAPCVIVKRREHGNADDFNFGYVSDSGESFNHELWLTRIKMHGHKIPLNCMSCKKEKKDLEDIVRKLPTEGKIVKITETEYQKVYELVG